MRYVNVFTRRGLGGILAKHASRVYAAPREALEGRRVIPDAGWILLGTLAVPPEGSDAMPTFVSEDDLRQTAASHLVAGSVPA